MMKVKSVLTFVLLGLVSQLYGQSADNQPRLVKIYSAFSVMSPVELKPVPSDLAGGKVKVFEAKRDKDVYRVFVVPYEKRPKTDNEFDEAVAGLEFILGGDDDSSFEEKFETIGSRRTKEIIYTKQNVRGLMIRGDTRIYVVSYETDDRSKSMTKGVTDFLKEFKFSKAK